MIDAVHIAKQSLDKYSYFRDHWVLKLVRKATLNSGFFYIFAYE